MKLVLASSLVISTTHCSVILLLLLLLLLLLCLEMNLSLVLALFPWVWFPQLLHLILLLPTLPLPLMEMDWLLEARTSFPLILVSTILLHLITILQRTKVAERAAKYSSIV